MNNISNNPVRIKNGDDEVSTLSRQLATNTAK